MDTHLRKIKDPLHGYIYLSEMESTFIQHPLMLRLHNIRQNGAAYLTYPAAHGMRFAHSLGAMHLGGLMFISAWENTNTDPSVRLAIVANVDKVLKKNGTSLRLLSNTAKETTETGSSIIQDGLYRRHHLVDVSQPSVAAALLCFQAVRLACLVHDIGHPPFSHTVETGLRQALADWKYPGHEAIGLKVLKEMIDDPKNDSLKTVANFVLPLVEILIDKRRVTNKDRKQWEGIQSLISGDIDADRLDYVRRDLITAGLESHTYDVPRLVDAAFFAHENGRISVEFTADALSSIEQFFHCRFQLYRWLIWHHNVIRHHLALSRATSALLRIPRGILPSDCDAMVAELSERARINWGVKQFISFTDGFLVDLLTRFRDHLEKCHPATQQTNTKSTSEMLLLEKLLTIFLDRKNSMLTPLWKRPDRHHAFARKVVQKIVEPNKFEGDCVRGLNKLLKAAFELPPFQKASSSEKREFRFCTALEKYLSTNKPGDTVGCVVAFYISKFKPGATDALRLFKSGLKETVKATSISPVLSNLEESWNSLPQLWLFVFLPMGPTNSELEKQLDLAATRLASFLKTSLPRAKSILKEGNTNE